MKTTIILSFFIFISIANIFGQKDLITTEIKKYNGYQEIWANNNGVGNITVSIEFTKQVNIELSRYDGITEVIPAGQSVKMVTVQPADPQYEWNYYYNYWYRMGDINAQHDNNYTYTLPFKNGKSYKILQGFHGSFSHFGDQEYALDFSMPVGTDFCAARDGRVVQIVQNNTGYGTTDYYRNHTNFIRVEHSDGTIAEYTHLKQNSVLVSVGDYISVGDVLAKVDLVGYTSPDPHLHFHVCRPLNGKDIETIYVEFKTTSGQAEELKKGVVYYKN